MAELCTAWMLGCTTVFFLGVTVGGRPRHPRVIPRATCSITFPDPGPSRRPTNAYSGQPVQPNPPPRHP